MIRAAALAAAVVVCAACGDAREAVSHRLHCSGSGSPPIVLESGLDATHVAWAHVQGTLAATSKTCSYDRLRGERRTADEDAADLHSLLQRARVRPPYVLVGHSFGGVLAYLYAANRPREVAGLVLVDSASPWQRARFLAALGRPRLGEPAIAKELRAFLSRRQPNREGIDVDAALAEARIAPRLGRLPLVVIEAGRENSGSLPPRLKHLLDGTWFALQTQLARLSKQHIHMIAPTSGHAVIAADGQPELVVAAVRVVVRTVRAHVALPKCSAAFARVAAQCVSG